jgi:hypothetical protein
MGRILAVATIASAKAPAVGTDSAAVVTPRAAVRELRIPYAFLRFVYGTMVCLDALLILATLLWDLGLQLPRGFGQLDLELEGNFAAWYSSALLLMAGSAAFMIAFGPPIVRDRPRLHFPVWMAGGFAFVGLAIDEMLEFHERLGVWYSGRYGDSRWLSPGLYGVFDWLVVLLPGIVVFVASAYLVIRSWLSVHRVSRNAAAWALACWIGTLCSEFIQAQLFRVNIVHSVEGAIEEGFEIIGSTLFFFAFTQLLSRPRD